MGEQFTADLHLQHPSQTEQIGTPDGTKKSDSEAHCHNQQGITDRLSISKHMVLQLIGKQPHILRDQKLKQAGNGQ
ncbi:hypothetical protein D3C71_1960000 [compost metagenome]